MSIDHQDVQLGLDRVDAPPQATEPPDGGATTHSILATLGPRAPHRMDRGVGIVVGTSRPPAITPIRDGPSTRSGGCSTPGRLHVHRERRDAHQVRQDDGGDDRLADERVPVRTGVLSLGLGIAGIYASMNGSQSWIAVTIPTSTFLFFAGVNHVVEMVRNHNDNPGNTFVCISDFGVPISLWALLFAAHVV